MARSPFAQTAASFAADAVIATAVLAMGLLDVIAGRAHQPALGLVVVLPLLARRRWPLAILVLVAIAAVATAVRQVGPWVPIGALSVAGFTFGEQSSRRALAALTVLAVATLMAVGLLVQASNSTEAVVLPFAVLLPSWLLGDVVRGRRDEATARAAAGERRAREAEERLRAGAADERRHMARELHDIVAHGMSVMLVQTAAARQVMDTAPLRANEALRDAEAAGRDAMGELRHLLAVLNDDGEIGGIAPQPGVEQLEGLIGRVRDAGLPVGLSISGEPRPLAPGVDITAYRIVQEALTNALRYAGGARTFVELAFEPAELRVEVLDDGPMLAPSSTDGAGRGLAGLGERVTKVGGRLEAGPRLGGGFAVRAWLPQRPSQ